MLPLMFAMVGPKGSPIVSSISTRRRIPPMGRRSCFRLAPHIGCRELIDAIPAVLDSNPVMQVTDSVTMVLDSTTMGRA
ncbi:hypothetical protein Pmani_018122 [Petrolisthes manimaculis]|uniref:Uncharacterized protein n=1 Tax=Petrolisthes manimaculis TaxID=1843537 RepID=A0AAE1PL12_9EUCA|nr:hypothetical protein Pmani_018122 [Petrolisthes manimaculis]